MNDNRSPNMPHLRALETIEALNEEDALLDLERPEPLLMRDRLESFLQISLGGKKHFGSMITVDS